MNRIKSGFNLHTACIIAAGCIVTLPSPAFANHGLQAMGDAFDRIAAHILTILVILSAASVVISIFNLWVKSEGLRAWCIILISPLFALTLLLTILWPEACFVGFVLLLIHGLLIYKSVPKKANHMADMDDDDDTSL